MALTQAAATLLASGLQTGTISPAFTNANSYIGVGDTSTAFATGQTDLSASTNKLRKGMDTTFPTLASNVITFQSTFATGDANWAWNEWGVFNAATAGTMLNRKVESLGTKLSTQTWQFNVALTISA